MAFQLGIATFIIISTFTTYTLSEFHRFHVQEAYRPNNDTSVNYGGRRIWLDVPTLTSTQRFQTARIMLYRELNNSVNIDSELPFTFKVFRFEPNEESRRTKIFVSSKEVPITEDRWISLDILSAVNFWKWNPTQNHGLLIKINHPNRTARLLPNNIGIVNVDGEKGKRPYVVMSSVNYNKSTSSDDEDDYEDED